jgi:hypothetical protein
MMQVIVAQTGQESEEGSVAGITVMVASSLQRLWLGGTNGAR